MGTIAINRGEVSADLKAIDSEAKALGNNMSASFKKVGDAVQKFLVVQAAAAATALVGVGVAGVKAFASFDKGMREVFTLLPDLNDEIRNELTEGVKDLSEELGIASSKVVPALYQAISAGIPQENVLDFIRTAGKAAIGGVTDLETAVDGLTSVVNAYGAETMSASRASDIMFTAVRLGKCVTLDTRVLLSDGRYEEIGKLRDGATVVSFDGVGLVPMRAEWVDRGTKPTVTLRTRLGREIKTTWNHPYLTAVCRHGPQCQGYECKRPQWVPVKDLKVGDRIAVPTHLPYFGTKAIAEEEASLLGLWLAEGSANGGTPRITTTAYGEEVSKWARHFGCHAIEVKAEQKCPSYSISAGPRGGHYTTRPKNEFTERLKQLGLDQCTAGNKHIPQEVFSWDRQSVATLLRWMFNGDGWLIKTTRGGFQVGYCSMSERLIRDVSHLLLRFGIVGRIRKRSQSNAWVWETNRWFEVSRFVEQIGIDRPQAKEVLQHEPEKQKRRSPGIEYDPIVAIEPGPEEPVCDLTVTILHNFVAEDILAHNTTMEEFSTSLFQVAPIASQLGVSFEEVSAWMAQLTLQGTPTSVAMTQIRAALVALTKDSTEAAQVFEQLTGQSFPQFIASGGSVADALDILRQYSDESGISLAALFGRVEGAMAVLGVTGGQLDGFRDKVEQMGASAGATDTAFGEMEQGLGRTFAKLRAWWDVTLIEIGEALEEPVRNFVDLLERNQDKIRDMVVNLFNRVAAALQWFIDNGRAVAWSLGIVATGFTAIWAATHPLAAAIAAVTAGMVTLVGWANSVHKAQADLNSTLTTSIDLWSTATNLVYDAGQAYGITRGAIGVLRGELDLLADSMEQHIRDGMDAEEAIGRWSTEVHALMRSYAEAFPEMEGFVRDYLLEFDKAVYAELELRDKQAAAAWATANAVDLSTKATYRSYEILDVMLADITERVEEFGRTSARVAADAKLREDIQAQIDLYWNLWVAADAQVKKLGQLERGTYEYAVEMVKAEDTLSALLALQADLAPQNAVYADGLRDIISQLKGMGVEVGAGKRALLEYQAVFKEFVVTGKEGWEALAEYLATWFSDGGKFLEDSEGNLFRWSFSARQALQYVGDGFKEVGRLASVEFGKRVIDAIGAALNAQKEYEAAMESATERFIRRVQSEGKSYEEREEMIADAVAKGLLTQEEANEALKRMTDDRIEYEKSAIAELAKAHEDAAKQKEEAEKGWLRTALEGVARYLQALAEEAAAMAVAETVFAGLLALVGLWAEAAQALGKAAAFAAKSAALFAASWVVRGLANLAEGGLAVEPTLAVVGEGRHEEAVLPLSDAVFAKIGAGIVEAMGKVQYPDMASWPEYRIEERVETISFERMFDGATINVRDKTDVQDLAAEIHRLFVDKQRGVGAVGVIR